MQIKKMPVKEIIVHKNAENVEFLLENIPCQSILCNDIEAVKINKGGYVLIDFGVEFQGGIKYAIEKISSLGTKLRIVFGESVMEALSTIGEKNATNHHAIRDMTVSLANYSQQYVGSTGFRFAKLEAIDGDVWIRHVDGIMEYRDIPYLGSFESDDELLNKIWKIAAYTVQLNMQEYLWDGIKRDRLVWIGDMHPETSSIAAVFGNCEPVTKSLDLIKSVTPPDEWMNGIPSYTMWWIKIQRDWYWQTGDKEYLLEQLDYLYKAAEHMLSCIDDNGNVNVEMKFVDWSSNEKPEMKAGLHSVTVLGLEAAVEVCDMFDNKELAKRCKAAIEKIQKLTPEYAGNKQIAALVSLAGIDESVKIREIIKKDGAHGLSTFLGYYTLQAMRGDMTTALELIRAYWGKMLDFGATTFWEDFDIDWTKNAVPIDEIVPEDKDDIHGDFGKFCYEKFRHSLCHGWASGPAPFLSQHVLGITPAEPGFKKVNINPNLGDLKHVKGTYPTPYGIIKVEYTIKDGKIQKKIELPEGVELA